MKNRLFVVILMAVLLLALGICAAQADPTPINVSTFADNGEVVLSGDCTINIDIDKTIKSIDADKLEIKGEHTLTISERIGSQPGVTPENRPTLTIASGNLVVNGYMYLKQLLILGGNTTVTNPNTAPQYRGHAINCSDGISIIGGSVEVTASKDGSNAFHTQKGFTISGGNVIANGSQTGTGTGIYTDGKDLIISGGTVKTDGAYGISSGHTEVNGGTVTSTGSSMGITVADISINGGTVTAKGTGSDSRGISAGSTIQFGNKLIKVTAEGTESAIASVGTNTEISLGDKLIIKEPADGKIVTTGNKTVIQSGDTTAKSVEIVPGTAYTVTYKLQDDWITWSDGTTGNKTEPVISGGKPTNVPTGMKAPQIPGYQANGSWYKKSSGSGTDDPVKNPANETITKDTTFVYKIMYITTKEELKKESTVYAGEIFVDGESQMQYLYSSDLSNQSQVFKNLKDALAGTAFSGLVPTISGQSENNGLAVSSDHQSDMNENWKSSSYVASQYFTGETGTEETSNLYDTNTAYKKYIDGVYQEIQETFDDALPFDKRMDTHLTTTTDFVWVNKDGVLVKAYTVTAYVELTKVIYTCVKIASPADVYTVTVTNDGNGIGTADPASGVTGTEVTLTSTPAEGYQFKEWQVVSGDVTITDNKFAIGTANVEIKAIFEKAESGNIDAEIVPKPGAPEVSGNIDEVAPGVVTAEEIAAGVKVWVEITPLEEADVPEADKKLAEATLETIDGKPGIWLDMSMFKQVTGQEKQGIYETTTGFKFTIKIPETLKKDGRTFYLVRIHQGESTILATTTGDELNGETDVFSTYLIAYKDGAEPTATPTAAPTDGPTDGPTATPTVTPTATPTVAPTATPTAKPTATPKPVPKTGDSAPLALWLGLIMLGLIGIGGAIVVKSRR